MSKRGYSAYKKVTLNKLKCKATFTDENKCYKAVENLPMSKQEIHSQ